MRLRSGDTCIYIRHCSLVLMYILQMDEKHPVKSGKDVEVELQRISADTAMNVDKIENQKGGTSNNNGIGEPMVRLEGAAKAKARGVKSHPTTHVPVARKKDIQVLSDTMLSASFWFLSAFFVFVVC